MFDRKLLKNNAKVLLRPKYWWSVLVVAIMTVVPLVISLLSMPADTFEVYSKMFGAYAALFSGNQAAAEQTMQEIGRLQMSMSPINSLFSAVSSAFSLLVATVIPVSYARFFLCARENPADLKEMFYPFRKKYGNNLGTMIVMQLLIAAWAIGTVIVGFFVAVILIVIFTSIVFAITSDLGGEIASVFMIVFFCAVYPLCCNIPILVKYYQYSMIPYILAENNEIELKRAFQLSKAMTKGYKWKLFVFDLSFIGWGLLALIVPFGFIFLNPYIFAARAEAYTYLKARALEKGLALTCELKGFSGEAAPAIEAAAETAAAAVAAEVPAAELAAQENADQ